jgi:hypothetical protein
MSGGEVSKGEGKGAVVMVAFRWCYGLAFAVTVAIAIGQFESSTVSCCCGFYLLGFEVCLCFLLSNKNVFYPGVIPLFQG